MHNITPRNKDDWRIVVLNNALDDRLLERRVEEKRNQRTERVIFIATLVGLIVFGLLLERVVPLLFYELGWL